MITKQAHDLFINPTLTLMEQTLQLRNSPEARVLVTATGDVESKYRERVQIGGPAHSFFQFERGGGVWNVLNTPKTAIKLAAMCDVLAIPKSERNSQGIYDLMVWNDSLATVMARLNYFSDPHMLPIIGDVEGAWNYYLRVWAPGKPRHADWLDSYAAALKACTPDV